MTRAGPILYLRSGAGDPVALTAILIVPSGEAAPDLLTDRGAVAGTVIATRCGMDVVRYHFELSAEGSASYAIGEERYEVDCAYGGDLRIAFVSCNGQEHGDEARTDDERNIMWQRLRMEHTRAPFHLLLHGGDQIYADEVTLCHPASRGWPDEIPALDDGEGEALTRALSDAFFRRYLNHFAHGDFAALAARVPSLAMWDDHDICDGWGSLAVQKLDSAVGRAIFAAARENFLLFQLGAAPHESPPQCLDESGVTLTFAVDLPGACVIAPDLRSERRPDRVMGENGWAACRKAFGAARGKVFVLSSVPALGPRLSHLERLVPLTPWTKKYEDDLRDQWQSGAHRPEWRDFLTELLTMHERDDTSVTVLSGEIHLATHGTMASDAGDLHQLVASGIAHPAPPAAYARALGLLASLGEAPLKDHPIRLHGLPGEPFRYTAQRNYLVLSRRDGTWTAVWELERSGPTPPLPL